MASRQGPLERALENVRHIEAQLIDDLVGARVGAGIGRPDLGATVGLSAGELGRIDRRERRSLTFEDVARYGAGVGLRLHARLYPEGDPLRDAGQARVLGRFGAELPPSVRFPLEVPVTRAADTRPADIRAWDGVVTGHGCIDAVEAETRFVDAQATVRRIMLKARDDDVVRHIILLLPDTSTNRRSMRAAREILRDTFPLDTREALRHLRRGECPGANAIVIL